MTTLVLILLFLHLLAQCLCQSSVNFEYLSPQGVRFNIPGPYRDTDTEYTLEAHVSLNEALKGDQGQYNGELTITKDGSLNFQVKQMKVKYFDTVYYSVKVQGTQGRTTWSQTLSGYKQVPVRDPHGESSQTSRPQQEVQTQRPIQKPTSGWSSEDIPDPIVEYLNPKGVRVTLPGPHRKSDVYLLKYHLNVNSDFNNVKSGAYNGEVTLPRGSLWSFTVRDLRVDYFDIVYYWVEVQGQEDSSTWTVQYKGYWQVPDKYPHESGPAAETESPAHRPTPETYSPTTRRPTTTTERPTTTTQRPTTTTTTQRPTTTTPRPTTTTPRPTMTTQRPTTTTQRPTTTTEKPRCRTSITVFNNGERPCAGEVVARDFSFNIIEQIGGLEPEESFTVFLKDCVQSKGEKFKSVVPMLLEDKYGSKARNGNLTLDSCTSKIDSLCSASASGFFILPPILSGRLNSYDHFSFRYGTIEVTAKLPSGDWVVPELWLMPKYNEYGDKSGRIMLAMSRGNSELHDGLHRYGRHVLEAGVQIGSNKQMLIFRKEQDTPWCDNFHKFRLVWTPNELRFYVDDISVGTVSPGPEGLDPSLKGSRLAPYDKEFYLVYGVHVGGDQDFPDTLFHKPWLNRYPKDSICF